MHLINLFEIRKRWEPDLEDSEYVVIAFRGDYWLLPTDGEDIPEDVLDDIQDRTGLELGDDWYSVLDEIRENRTDVIVAMVDLNDRMLYISPRANELGPNPITSPMIKKLVRELRLDGATLEEYDAYDEFETSRTYYDSKEMTGQLPRVLFHGTTAKRALNIIRTGLRPGLGNNYKEIEHENIVFGTTHLDMAIHHAHNAFNLHQKFDNPSEQPDSYAMLEYDDFPVVIEFRVPDPNLLVPDYDVAAQTMGASPDSTRLGYTGMNQSFNRHLNPEIPQRNPEGRVWKSTGKFGYAGRVPPSHIIGIHTTFFDGVISPGRSYWSGPPREFAAAWRQAAEQLEPPFPDDEED